MSLRPRTARPWNDPMETFLTSTALVALAEIGDKTQLLAILLATRYRPLPIILGILAATLANHFLAALLGAGVAGLLDGFWFRAAIAASFIAMGLWTLVPDKLDEEETGPSTSRGAFLATLIAFFLVEMGDKTQIATIALGARFHDALLVTVGTTVGMMLANGPAVLAGRALLRVVPLNAVRITAATLFVAIGLWMAVQLWFERGTISSTTAVAASCCHGQGSAMTAHPLEMTALPLEA